RAQRGAGGIKRLSQLDRLGIGAASIDRERGNGEIAKINAKGNGERIDADGEKTLESDADAPAHFKGAQGSPIGYIVENIPKLQHFFRPGSEMSDMVGTFAGATWHGRLFMESLNAKRQAQSPGSARFRDADVSLERQADRAGHLQLSGCRNENAFENTRRC